VDASGNINTGGTLTVAGAATSTFTGPVALGAGSTVGGKALNTDAHRFSDKTARLFAGSVFAAGTCQSEGMTLASDVEVGMAVADNPETVPPDGLIWDAYIDRNHRLSIRICNATAGPIHWTSGAIWHVRVLP
jgi:hypothetical protein